MHYMDADVWGKRLTANTHTASSIEPVLADQPHKLAAIRPTITHHENHPTRHMGHCWRSKDELISDVLQWAPSHGRANVGRPARTYQQQLCADTECSLDDLPGAIDDREEWRESVRVICDSNVTGWWSWLSSRYICSLFDKTIWNTIVSYFIQNKCKCYGANLAPFYIENRLIFLNCARCIQSPNLNGIMAISNNLHQKQLRNKTLFPKTKSERHEVITYNYKFRM